MTDGRIKKPCKNCGHPKTHHSTCMIPIPNSGWMRTLTFLVCQDCCCQFYQYKNEYEKIIYFRDHIKKIFAQAIAIDDAMWNAYGSEKIFA
jgi:hypothetical protein